MSVSEIASASVALLPPDESFVVNQAQLNDLAKILQAVVTYNKVPSEPLAGQAVSFTITKTDEKTTKVVSMGGDLLEIDGVRYQVMREPNTRLREFGFKISENA